MKFYGDIGKTAKKLLTDDYIFTNKLKVASKTGDGTSYTITGVHNVESDAIDADIATKAKIKGVAVTSKLFTNSKKATIEAKYELKDDKAGKTTISGLVGQGIGSSTVEFEGGLVGIKAAADFITRDISSSVAVTLSPESNPGFAVIGGDVTYSLDKKDATRADFALSYFDGKESECSLHVLDKATKGMVSYSHHVRAGFSVGAQMKYDRDTKATVLAMGNAYRLDGATTVKTKIDSEGTLALSYIQDIRSNTTLIMSSKFDVKKFESAKVGISLCVE